MWMGKSRYSWFSYSSSSLEGTGKFSSVSCLSLTPLPSGDRTGFGSIQEQCNLPSLSSFRVAPLTVLHISSANLVSESFNSIIFLMAWSPLWALTRLSWLMVSRWEWPGGCLGKKCCAWPTKPHLSVPLPDSHPMYCKLPHLRTPLCKLSHMSAYPMGGDTGCQCPHFTFQACTWYGTGNLRVPQATNDRQCWASLYSWHRSMGCCTGNPKTSIFFSVRNSSIPHCR